MRILPNPSTWKVKTTFRSKNRMKLNLKLSQEETAAFNNFSDSVKPEGLALDEFVRSIFFAGIRTLEEQLTANLVKHMEENRAEFEASGFSFDDEGKLTGVDQEQGGVTILEDEAVEVDEESK